MFQKTCLIYSIQLYQDGGVSVVENSINHTPVATACIYGACEKISCKCVLEGNSNILCQGSDLAKQCIFHHLFILLSIITVKRLVQLFHITVCRFADHIADPARKQVQKDYKHE